jgi:hypothetical protein
MANSERDCAAPSLQSGPLAARLVDLKLKDGRARLIRTCEPRAAAAPGRQFPGPKRRDFTWHVPVGGALAIEWRSGMFEGKWPRT